ncbi:hypothetical protein Glove_425g14 [Diversispora epigaea]|uniref:Uncharacterized protein n=1 Tax=Diversispora epigaea TaxID=1348612 RepID=A0A397GYU4_9GLOM|nr:hypothetical protein Glove_425g14 [Diversispora epigaea]
MTNFDATTIHNKILKKLTHGCFGNPSHVVILKVGRMPSNNEGMWHTNKNMLSAIITIFSSYGIFDLCTAIGVKFLDKFEKVIDYRATIRTIELLLAHKTGIRIGNFEIQKYILATFASLLPSAGKSNYAQSKNIEKLQYVLSFKVSEEKRSHFLAFDEALETFSVKFVKQNITGNVIDSENLKRQIKAAQTEYERIKILLNKYLNNIPTSNYDYTCTQNYFGIPKLQFWGKKSK